jgi:hypothetical protein
MAKADAIFAVKVVMRWSRWFIGLSQPRPVTDRAAGG